MNILILGSGGREHAFAWKISQSKRCEKLYIAPGNAGTSLCGENVAIDLLDFPSIATFCLKEKINLVLVGPEDPLVKGIHDYFLSRTDLKEVYVIGPVEAGAQLEGSKDFSKAFMMRNNIPTARYRTFTKNTLEEGITFLKELKPPYVLKADGLAAGKGVVIVNEIAQAERELKEMLQEAKFGAASERVVIEEYLDGIELSFFVLTDGIDYKLLPSAKDYKRIGEKDTGLNTGGMGAVSPVPFADETFLKKVEERIVKPTINGLREMNIVYKGFVFIGLMNVNGDPYVIEYNCRMGDPETEVVLPRIESDFVDLLEAVAFGTLEKVQLKITSYTATTVMAVSGGYPEQYKKGFHLTGLEDNQGSLIFHAGTQQAEGRVISAGGRVFAVTSLAPTLKAALSLSYKNLKQVHFEGMYYRNDIGQDLLN